ncbi:MAG: ice-binding family protein [Luteolibacter sp.]
MIPRLLCLGSLICTTATYAQNLSLGSASGFGLLGLENGTVTINSATKLVGNVGYSKGVVSNINQKVESFRGSALVHSKASFSYTAASFQPSGGIQKGAATDSRLDSANQDVLLLAQNLSGLTATQSVGFLNDNDSRTFVSTGSLNVIDISGVNYLEDSLTLQSRSGLTDTFILRVAGNFRFSASSVILEGLTASNVMFYFPNESKILIENAATTFNGTILAPMGWVEYQSPGSYNGSIIAKNINLQSALNHTQVNFVPEPSAAFFGVIGAALLVLRRKR